MSTIDPASGRPGAGSAAPGPGVPPGAGAGPPPFPCGHGGAPEADGYRLACPACGSFWDADFLGAEFEYGADYPGRRLHFDPAVGRAKARSLEGWLDRCGLRPAGLAACEVGFGAGWCLRALADAGAWVCGIEAVKEDLAHARGLGIPEGRLFRFESMPKGLERPIDLWLFLDSFEHLSDPARFLRRAAAWSSPRARVLLVAPRADSMSNRWMGRFWPHKVRDHRFHWSRAGVAAVFERQGFEVSMEFSPVKVVTLPMAAAHVIHHGALDGAWLRALRDWGPARIALPFNIGEMGLLFARAGGAPASAS